MPRPLRLVVPLTLVLAIALPDLARALAPPVSPEEMTRRADLAIEGEVAAVTWLRAGGDADTAWVEYRAEIRIDRVLKGRNRAGDRIPITFSVYTWRGKGQAPPHVTFAPRYVPCERVRLFLKALAGATWGYVAWNAKGSTFHPPSPRMPTAAEKVVRCVPLRP